MKFLIPFLAALLLAGPAMADRQDDCQAVVSFEFNPTEAGATDDYVNLVDGGSSATIADEDAYVTPSLVLHASHLFASVDVAPTADDTWQFTLVDDGVSTILTCDITGATDTTCENTDYGSVARIEKNSKLTVLVDSSTGLADPAIAAVAQVSFCLQHRPGSY